MPSLNKTAGTYTPLHNIFSGECSQFGDSYQTGHYLDTHKYTELTDRLLNRFYPKYCCNQKLTKTDGIRETVLRCPKCRKQQSRLSGTPLHHFKLPRWYFSYLLQESIIRYPQVLTASEISRKLNISGKAGLTLKRRLQLFASEVLPYMESKFYNDLHKEFNNFKLPSDKNTDITGIVKDRSIPQTDTVVLYSCRSTANKGRKRYGRTGQTASIYRSESLGGDQVGTLVNVLGVKQGPVFYTSIPNQTSETINPILRHFLPYRAPLFSDRGYVGYPGPNHRMVNHSLKSKDKRYRFSKDRWSKNGIHCNVAEANNNILKRSFKAYVYIRPKYSQMYLNEYAFYRNLRYYNLDDLVGESIVEQESKMRERVGEVCPKGDLNPHEVTLTST